MTAATEEKSSIEGSSSRRRFERCEFATAVPVVTPLQQNAFHFASPPSGAPSEPQMQQLRPGATAAATEARSSIEGNVCRRRAALCELATTVPGVTPINRTLFSTTRPHPELRRSRKRGWCDQVHRPRRRKRKAPLKGAVVAAGSSVASSPPPFQESPPSTERFSLCLVLHARSRRSRGAARASTAGETTSGRCSRLR